MGGKRTKSLNLICPKSENLISGIRSVSIHNMYRYLWLLYLSVKFQVNPDDQEAVCSKSVQTDQNALNEKRNGYYNGLFGNICCEEVII